MAGTGRTDYDTDFYSWSLEQARLVRQGLWAELDRDNVAEEIESLAQGQFDKLETAFRVLLIHMLKWDHQPKRRSRSWIISIKEQRLEIDDILKDNPGLRPRIPEAIDRAYRKAILAAAKETKLDEAVFSETLVYSFEDMMKREFVL
jgi:hypothetical protein